MTQAIELPLASVNASERRLVGGVCFGHLVSHYYITLLAPLFVFVREDYGVTYTELGLALTAFNVLTGAAPFSALPRSASWQRSCSSSRASRSRLPPGRASRRRRTRRSTAGGY